MNIKKENIEYIFESPDGITVYRRRVFKYQPREIYDKAKKKWILN
jgi:hypothetical protein|tara:strand:- start:3314 stop:3448 length:135 start_codon:yes stop_codon:yes gene_type:complete